MSMTLNLVDQLLSLGGKFQDMGRKQDALRILGRLSRMRDLPNDAVRESRTRLGELHLEGQRFTEARKHLRAALAAAPEDAATHYLMAQALDQDEYADPRKALAHYRQALAADPDQPYCLVDLGTLALEQGEIEEGLQALRQAAELAPHDAEIIGKLVTALVEQDQLDEARQAARAALFQHSRDAAFRKVWSDLQFQELRLAQEENSKAAFARDGEDEPIVLPFARPAGFKPTSPVAGKIVRHDTPSLPRPPHGPRLGIYTDKKHA